MGDGLPYGEAHEARNSGQPPAKSQGRTEAFIPTTHEELHPVNNHVSGPGGDPPPLPKAGCDRTPGCNNVIVLVTDLESEDPSKLALDSPPQKLRDDQCSLG